MRTHSYLAKRNIPRWCFYVSGGGYTLLFLLTCLLMPQDPLDAPLMPRRERKRFQKERGNVVEEDKKGKPSIRTVLGCWCVYKFILYISKNVEFRHWSTIYIPVKLAE